MTSARQQQKTWWTSRRGLSGIVLAAVLAVVGCPGFPLSTAASTNDRVVNDRHTGLAIGGFDPVAYFTDGIPIQGRPGVEYTLDGVTWRFRNEGNRAAFMAKPQVYMPRLGGYDPVGVARGVAVAGNPEIWLLSGQQLWLFYDEAARDAFVADAERIAGAAERHWPEVVQTLAF